MEPLSVIWDEAAFPLRLSPGDVHVWLASLELPLRALCHAESLLTSEELTRAGRFHFLRDQFRYIAAHAGLRVLSAGYLGIPPAEVRYAHNSHGKPFIADGHSDLRFNLSHSGSVALYAFAAGVDVGVDVEQIRVELADMQTARNTFAMDETACLLEMPAEKQAEAFFACWTRKEAYIKALGLGLSTPLDQFHVSINPGESVVHLRVDGKPAESERWCIRTFRPLQGYIACVCAEGRSCSFHFLQYSDPFLDRDRDESLRPIVIESEEGKHLNERSTGMETASRFKEMLQDEQG